jgi:hypothetical protein
MFGWNGIGDLNVREGGRSGYSGGKERWQRKLPPGWNSSVRDQWQKQRRGEHTAVVFTVIGDHEHHFPLEDIVVYQPARYSGQVFSRLHGF